MTKGELAQLRAECRAVAAESLLRILVRADPRRARDVLPTVDDWLNGEGQGLTFPMLEPAYAELYAGEGREAVADLLVKVQAW